MIGLFNEGQFFRLFKPIIYRLAIRSEVKQIKLIASNQDYKSNKPLLFKAIKQTPLNYRGALVSEIKRRVNCLQEMNQAITEALKTVSGAMVD